MTFPSIRSEVQSMEDIGDKMRVVVHVDTVEATPDEFQELRARATALTATGFASTVGDVVENVELGKVDRLTQIKSQKQINTEDQFVTKEFTVIVDTPF